METSKINGVKCPKCENEQVICSKRGYSFLIGIAGAILTFVVYCIVWIYASGYNDMSEMVQNTMIAINTSRFVASLLLGLLWGFVGRNKLVYQCAACGKRFKPDTIKEETPKLNMTLFITVGVIVVLLGIFLIIG